MVHCRSFASEAALGVGNKVIRFNQPNQPFVDHTHDRFTKAAC